MVVPVPHTLRSRIVALVSHEFGVPQPVLLRQTRAKGGWPVLARQLCLYLASVEAGHGDTATAQAFGTVRENVRYAVRRVEEHRDTPIFEIVIERIVAPLRAEGVLQ